MTHGLTMLVIIIVLLDCFVVLLFVLLVTLTQIESNIPNLFLSLPHSFLTHFPTSSHTHIRRFLLMQLYSWSPNTFNSVWNARNCDIYILTKDLSKPGDHMTHGLTILIIVIVLLRCFVVLLFVLLITLTHI